MSVDVKEHWETIYQTKKSNEVSWYQKEPTTSLRLIAELGLNKDAKIIDIGAGDSRLVDNLLVLGYRKISVLDVSANALKRAKKRIGSNTASVQWIVSDIRDFETNDRYDLWHDRAVLHFLTTEEDMNKYARIVRRSLKPDGYLIVATFSEHGPKRCSGLDVTQYSQESMKKLFNNFEHVKSFEEEHTTPSGTIQNFIYGVFQNRGDAK